MDIPLQPIAPETEVLLQRLGGPISVVGTQGDYVVMRSDVYTAMLGITEGEEAETLASIRRGLDDLKAGRVHDLDEAFDEIDARDES
jgi:hypothetical protein